MIAKGAYDLQEATVTFKWVHRLALRAMFGLGGESFTRNHYDSIISMWLDGTAEVSEHKSIFSTSIFQR